MCSLDKDMPGLCRVTFCEVGSLLLQKRIDCLCLDQSSEFAYAELKGLPLAFDKFFEYMLKDESTIFTGIIHTSLAFFAEGNVLKFGSNQPGRYADTIYAKLTPKELSWLIYRAIWCHDHFYVELKRTLSSQIYSLIYGHDEISFLEEVRYNSDTHLLVLAAAFKSLFEQQNDIISFLFAAAKGEQGPVDAIAGVARDYMRAILPEAKKIPLDLLLQSLVRGLDDAIGEVDEKSHPFTCYMYQLFDDQSPGGSSQLNDCQCA